MKKLMLFCLIGGILNLNGQNSSNRAYHDKNGWADKLVGLDGNFFFSAVSYNPGFSDHTDLVSVDRAGIERFRLPLLKDEVITVSDLIATGNKELLAVGFGNGCDYHNIKPNRFLVRFDTSGNKIFDVAFDQNTVVHTPTSIFRIAEAPGGDIFLGIDSCIYHFNSAGILLSKKNLGFGSIGAILAPSDTQLLVYANSGGTKNILVDTSGAVLSSIASGIVKRYLSTSSGRIMAFTQNGMVEKLATGLASKSVHSLGAGTIDAVLHNDTIYSITAGHAFAAYDTAFAVLNTYSLSVPLRSVISLAFTQGEVGFLSNGGSFSVPVYVHAQNGSHPAFTSFKRANGFLYTQDVGVIGVTCDSCAVSGGYIGYYFKLKVKVRNYGAQPVNSFYLNCAQYTEWICGEESYHQEFTGITVPPGDSIEVTTFSFTLRSVPYEGWVGSTYLAKNLQFFTSAPNREIDNVAANDVKMVALVMKTGLTDQARFLGVTTCPNPTRDFMNWEAGVEIDNIVVTSVDAKVVKCIPGGGFSGQIKVEDLKTGIYFITFYSDSGKAVKKFIKQ